MSDQPLEVLDSRRLNRSILIARIFVVVFIMLPLLPFIYVAIASTQIASSPDQGEALFESVRLIAYGAIVTSCLLLPVAALIGLRLTFRKRSISQKPEHGRTFLGAMVVWVMYAFLTLALGLLWFVSPNAAP
jgi:hypothetical protein